MYIVINKDSFHDATLTSAGMLKGSRCRHFIITRSKGPRDKKK